MRALRLLGIPENGMRYPSDEVGNPTHDFVPAANGKCHAMSDQWGFPVCEDGDVGRRVVAFGVPGGATRVNVD